jgi:hypothetical protein
MDSKKSKILTIITGIIGLIGVFFLIRIIMVGDEAVETSVDVQSSIVDPFITFSYILLIIATIITLVLSIVNLVKHPKALKKTLMSLAVLGVLLVISYFMASDAAVTDGVGKVLKDGAAGATSKWVSALINFSAILGVIGLGAIGAGFVKSLIK